MSLVPEQPRRPMRVPASEMKRSPATGAGLGKWIVGSVPIALFTAFGVQAAMQRELLDAACAAGLVTMCVATMVGELRAGKPMKRLGAGLRASQQGDRVVVEVELSPPRPVDIEQASVALVHHWSELIGEGEDATTLLHEVGRSTVKLSGPARLGKGDVVKRRLELLYRDAEAAKSRWMPVWRVELSVTPRDGESLREVMDVEAPVNLPPVESTRP